MAIEADGIRRRVERLNELASKMEKESGRVSRDGGPLSWAEQQQYARAIMVAGDGLERADLVLRIPSRGSPAARRDALQR